MSRSAGSTVRLTTSQAIVKYLQVQWSERDGERQRLVPAILGIFGHGNVSGLGQALDEYGQELPFLEGRNEQSMVHAAAGHARATRRRSTLACAASIGPGSLNMVTGAAAAHVNRLPVLLLPADGYATRHQGTVLQSLEYPLAGDVTLNDCFRPVARFFDRIVRPEHLLTALPEAMRVLTSPVEAGPVVLSLPQDLQSHAYDFPVELFEERVWRIERPLPDARRIGELVELLRSARRPVVIAGGGVHYSEAGAELQAFAQRFGVPVAETYSGKGVLQEESWVLLGGLGLEGTMVANHAVKSADLVISIGTRLSDFMTGSRSLFQNPDVRFAAINVCDADARKLGALPIVADAREAIRALGEAAGGLGVTHEPAYEQELAARKAEWQAIRDEFFAPAGGERMGQSEAVGALNAAARPGDTVISAAGTPVGELLKFWDATGGRDCHLEFGFSTMGYDIPAAIGVRLARQDGEVYALIGDGNFLMNPSELVTAVQNGLKITVVLSENQGMVSVRRLELARTAHGLANQFRARNPETKRLDGELLPLDFALVARGLGATTFEAWTAGDMQSALEAARAETGPCVIVCHTDPERHLPRNDVWWDVAPAEVSGEPAVRAFRDTYERERAELQRFYY